MKFDVHYNPRIFNEFAATWLDDDLQTITLAEMNPFAKGKEYIFHLSIHQNMLKDGVKFLLQPIFPSCCVWIKPKQAIEMKQVCLVYFPFIYQNLLVCPSIFWQTWKWGHPCPMDTFLVIFPYKAICNNAFALPE